MAEESLAFASVHLCVKTKPVQNYSHKVFRTQTNSRKTVMLMCVKVVVTLFLVHLAVP